MCFSKKSLYLFLSVLVLSFSGEAKLFHNAYMSFQIPDGWNCKQIKEKYGWSCQSERSQVKKTEAIIMLMAKEAGSSDGINQYIEVLKKPISNKQLKLQSKVEQFNPKKVLKGHDWVDGLHYSSALPRHYTRYLVTRKKGLAIILTFTVHKDSFSKYSLDFINTVNSIRLRAPKNYLDLARNNSQRNKGSIIGDLSVEDFGSEAPKKTKPKSTTPLMKFIFLTLLTSLFGGAYFFLKRKRKQKV